jgi:hypothetical protein
MESIVVFPEPLGPHKCGESLPCLGLDLHQHLIDQKADALVADLLRLVAHVDPHFAAECQVVRGQFGGRRWAMHLRRGIEFPGYE